MNRVSLLLSPLMLAVLLLRNGLGRPEGGSNEPSFRMNSASSDRPVLILDVDNTLYSEQQVKAQGGFGIEEQIVRNTHSFCQRHLNMSPEQADELFREYGSTIEGIRHTLLNNASSKQTHQMMARFYHEVYDPIDVSALLDINLAQKSDITGYSHTAQGRVAFDMLHSAPGPVYLASNSPSWHVQKVLRALGLSGVTFAGILTPDSVEDKQVPFPTKSLSRVFYQPILRNHKHERLILLDDSKLNLERAEKEVGMEGIHISSEKHNLHQALGVALGHVEGDNSVYEFSEIRYLAAKNLVDAQSIHNPTWQQVARHLSDALLSGDGTLRIVDVGAGILSMLELIMMGHSKEHPPLDFLLESRDETVRELRYYAYEPNLALFLGCRATLTRLGFVGENDNSESEPNADEDCIYHHTTKNVTVRLRMRDFATDPVKDEPPPHMIVGCCFADLLDPHQLVQSLHRFLQTWKATTRSEQILAYFPITFTGTTQFLPPKPFQFEKGNEKRGYSIPSDTTAFELYSSALKHRYGHSLDPNLLVKEMASHGNVLLARGASNWIINPVRNSYLWRTLMYFFGTVGAPELLKNGWDATGWVRRAKSYQPTILVTNADLLFSMKQWSSSAKDPVAADAAEKKSRSTEDEGVLNIKEIQFVAPRNVTMTKKTVNTIYQSHLGPNQVEVTSVCSLISSGTELKVFKGLFDDAALDVNIKGMAEERMAYPLSYGYSLVGRVTRCGSNISDADDILGKLVFSFSPHVSHVIADRDSLHLVPDGVDARDAVFLPSVETALSLVHDANIRAGENVAVFGQGLIGLLVTCILSAQTVSCSSSNGRFGTITTFDTIPERLAASSAMGASEALLPRDAKSAGPFDVSIEVSGNARALQSAIDHTASGGRIVVGSWYGNADVRLKLGIDFHRSHKTIITSQVSELRSELLGLWTKQRRFALAWDLVKQIRPSRLITRTATLAIAQEAYELLDEGSEIAVCFDYSS